ncbi:MULTISPECIES: hypothetical protein [Aerococcus]|uniref:Uncharacterized protein n=1 Tax=Aerococcus mictus TaxID=2976810 RepID=A0A1E9PJF3_9LACT|nr:MULTISPECIES: hypothetical protein [Aerococcus]AEA01150.1 hypothetical protein HMPREF9243_0103 [Aerococcus sp. Group 1]KAA9290832.1 hypothetical protein F6I06_07620 [Aerococcus mictus]MBU5610621.1 hypothetical protein [Aerococcus urinae]MCY3031462.1 hypothetical protein [Aerococcus sp. Group 1]MCY3039713.1 hypothetical protein [Aerococcus sp. Group 2]
MKTNENATLKDFIWYFIDFMLKSFLGRKQAKMEWWEQGVAREAAFLLKINGISIPLHLLTIKGKDEFLDSSSWLGFG